MKLTYFGTAAAEGFPAVYCNCKFCQEARRLGGKNIRTRSQAMVNDDLLIDYPADTYWHFINNGVEGDLIKYLLITHSHGDHLYTDDLEMRNTEFFAHDLRVPVMEIFCGKGAYDKIIKSGKAEMNMKVTLVEPFKPFKMGDYTVTPLPARHKPGDNALIYIIEGDKTLLYANDTGYFFDEVFDYIKENNIRFDMISYDCTCVDIPEIDEGYHMGIANIERVSARLREMGAVDNDTVEYINHFSHNGNPIHHVLEERVKNLGYGVSYDGCSVEI